MKKLVFVFVAFVAVSFASCGNKAANNSTETVAAEATVCEHDSTAACCGDSTACEHDSTAVCDSAKVAE